jgi:predicted amidohydrolase YtcJ
VQCGSSGADRRALADRLRAAAAALAPGQWLRGVGYDDVASGPLDGAGLDELLGPFADRAVRIQHRSGHAWILNTTARTLLGVPGDGLLVDSDEHVRAVLGGQFPDLGALSRELAAYGVTGVTDAGPDNSTAEWSELREQGSAGRLRQRCLVMGGAALSGLAAELDGRLRVGPVKIMLVEPDLPGLDELSDLIAAAGPRPVAIHAVTEAAVVLSAVAISAAGDLGGHRIEHASVADRDVIELVARAGATVVTQPGFVAAHGDRYLATVAPGDIPSLYRLAGWLAAGVALAGSSDAPFGPLDPWRSMRVAVTRMSDGGQPLGEDERLTPEQALALYTSPLERPGSAPRPISVGDRADLTLLRGPWREARQELSADLVRATVVAGQVVHQSD